MQKQAHEQRRASRWRVSLAGVIAVLSVAATFGVLVFGVSTGSWLEGRGTMATPTTTQPITTPPRERFYVVGPDIIAPDGSKFIPIGANVGAAMVSWVPGTYAFTSTGLSATGHAADAMAWGWNTVRVNVVCNPGPDVTFEETVNGVQALIDEYTARKIVVMPACHDVTGADAPVFDNRYVLVHAFWDALLKKNGNNPYVWVNYVNEPFTLSSADPRWAATGEELYRRVRSSGSENLFIWDFPTWGQGADDLGSTSNEAATRFLAGKCNAVLSWHNYGAAGTPAEMSMQAQSFLDRRVPVIVGEVGYDWAGHRYSAISYEYERRGATWAFDNVWRYGFGVVAWHGTGTEDESNITHSLRRDNGAAWYDTSRPLSEAGARLHAIGTNKPASTRPSVDLAGSTCPSAQD